MKRSTVAGKLAILLQAELKEARYAQKQSVDVVGISEKRVIDAAAQLADFVWRITEVEEETKLANKKLTDMERQMTLSGEIA